MLDGLEYVVLHHFFEFCGGPVPGGDPVGHLAGPDEVMAAHGVTIVIGQVHEVVPLSEVEDILLGLGIHELCE